MTRFWLTLNEAIELVLFALSEMDGCIYVKKCSACLIKDIAEVMAGEGNFVVKGKRPGEKLHEVLVSDMEMMHTEELVDHNIFKVNPFDSPVINEPKEFTSENADRLSKDELRKKLIEEGWL
ncbi:MAG: polysaccharide biosynthesis protein [Candidatus Thermoplasmatota archaeon]|nr:polysaccharide biosynthesis protein [Candidatus Thermoplasmatota archaeon]